MNIAEDFRLTDTYSPSLPVALFLLGNGLGPLYLAPLSEVYGRRIVYICCFSLFGILNIGCALSPDITSLSILRFLDGMAGSAASTLSGASVGDMFVPAERGRAQAFYGMIPLLGPVLGGVIGGYIVAGTGTWRWLMWVMVIAPAVSVIACMFLLRETYAPFLERKHARQMQLELPEEKAVSKDELFKRAILRPIRLLFLSPVCAIMAIYIAL